MPLGFVGNGQETYLSDVQEALSTAASVHNRHPFSTGSGLIVPLPALPVRTNVISPHPPGATHGGSPATGIRNSSNIVVDSKAYQQIFDRISSIDDHNKQKLYDVAKKIEDLCQTSFVVPKTVVECKFITTGILNSLDQFGDLTGEARTQMESFVEAILRIS